jgi:predicted PurR-regulated permease PerM
VGTVDCRGLSGSGSRVGNSVGASMHRPAVWRAFGGKALLLLGWGAAVVGQVDVLVRPYVISKQVKIHTLLLFFALLGRVKAFGIMGLFIGPIVISITTAVFGMLGEINSSSTLRSAGRASCL